MGRGIAQDPSAPDRTGPDEGKGQACSEYPGARVCPDAPSCCALPEYKKTCAVPSGGEVTLREQGQGHKKGAT